VRYLNLVFALLLLPTLTYARDLFWQAGASLNLINTPLYPGSNQKQQFLLPLPYLKIKHPLIEVDQGIRAFIFKNPKLNLNISADLGFPVNSEDSRLRQNMPDLKTVMQIGPSLEISLFGQHNSQTELRFDLPLRLALASDIKQTQSIGWIFEPRFSYHSRRDFKHNLAIVVESGLRFASREYHAYYYDVAATFATDDRPTFQAAAGYNGFFTDLGLSWRWNKLTLFGFIRYQNINKAAFVESPLVEKQHYLLGGISLIYTLASNQH